jgi:dephospho-CoA kinase
MLLGLAGGYSSGKSTVASLLEGEGWAVVDADALGHEAIELARGAIAARFGDGVLGPDGRVDRRAVARIVFSDPAALADQEAIVHPIAIRLVGERVAAAAEAARSRGEEARTCVHAALLHRSGLVPSLDAILLVEASLFARIARALSRDRTGLLDVLRRIARQRDFSAELRRQAGEAGVPIVRLRNSGSRAELERRLRDSLARALARARGPAAR